MIKKDENQGHFCSFDKCNLTHFETGPNKEFFQINHMKKDNREKSTCNTNKKSLTVVNQEHFSPGENGNVTVNIHSSQGEKFSEVVDISEW